MKKLNSGWIIVILLSIMPVIIWVLTPKISTPFLSIQNIIISFGQIFGLVGIVMFSLNFILAARLMFVEKLFGGLNNVYKKHSLLGQLALILLLFHPLFLIPRYSNNLKEAASFLFLSSSWARNFGIIALEIMIVSIVLTLYLRPRYNIWKITHKFLGVALFLGALHVYLIPTYLLSTNSLLNIYILGFAILGIIAFLYRSVFSKILIKRYQYLVKDIIQLNDNVIEISLEPLNRKIQYHPGQFIFVSFKQEGLSSETHPFSISSSPNDDLLKITVKNLGDYTKKLITNLHQGALTEIEGPYGTFSYSRVSSKDQVWIVGGIGITPFISFAKDLKKRKGYSVKLFYCVKNENKAIYMDELQDVEKSLDNNFLVIPFYSEEKGHISSDYLLTHIKNLNQKDISICAPPRMIEELRKDLIINGINKNRIHSEEFNL